MATQPPIATATARIIAIILRPFFFLGAGAAAFSTAAVSYPARGIACSTGAAGATGADSAGAATTGSAGAATTGSAGATMGSAGATGAATSSDIETSVFSGTASGAGTAVPQLPQKR
ncbi:MAG: hypothetical protein E7550_05850 [Ruminococcaceae bacterium]|nr:hypothetical protein [Oscillospiraceae bacterium]